MNLGERLQKAMNNKGYNPNMLGKESGIHPSTIKNWLDNKKADYHKIVKVSNVLDVNPEWLYTGGGEMSSFSAENISSLSGIDDNTVVDYLIENAKRLQKENKKFQMWLEVIALKAKLEALEEADEKRKGA